MKAPYNRQVERIVAGIDFPSPGQLAVTPARQTFEFVPENGDGPGNLPEILTRLLYDHFYCPGTHPGDPPPPASQQSHPAFIEKLQTANHSREGFDRGWTVMLPTPAGAVYVRKGNYRRLEPAGRYLYEQTVRSGTGQGGQVRIFQRKENHPRQDVFYYAFGETIGETGTPGSARFYFHLKPEGSVPLLEALTSRFNQYQIPFTFKCLDQPSLYYRADAAVLYLSKCYVSYASRYLRDVYQTVRPHCKKGVPLFARRLAEGLAFAENPLGENESFGMNRCAVIARGLSQAYRQGLPKEAWPTMVLRSLRTEGLDPDKPYLNPNTHYPYYFPTFN